MSSDLVRKQKQMLMALVVAAVLSVALFGVATQTELLQGRFTQVVKMLQTKEGPQTDRPGPGPVTPLPVPPSKPLPDLPPVSPSK